MKTYNTTIENFNKYRLIQLNNEALIDYTKLVLNNACEKEHEMNENKTEWTCYRYAASSQNVNAILIHLHNRGLMKTFIKSFYVQQFMESEKKCPRTKEYLQDWLNYLSR